MNSPKTIERLRLLDLVSAASKRYGLAITQYARGKIERADLDTRRDEAHATRRDLAAYIRAT